MSGGLSQYRSLLQAIANTLSNKEICALLTSADKKLINIIGEIAYNLTATENFDLSTAEKSSLRPFKSSLIIVVQQKLSIKLRRQTLVKQPNLVRNLSKIALIHVPEENTDI